jgi:hypothetical protein
MISSRAAVLAVSLTFAAVSNFALQVTPAAGEEASWRLEQPPPPPPPPGVEGSSTPIGLGKIGDIEFFAPNRGLLITAGNPPTIPPGVWAYNGIGWHELATVCGATDGRIAWAGPEEFWTVSDGRRGQAEGLQSTPLEDDTLCHFAAPAGQPLEVKGSYASLAFRSDSYQPMHGASCLSASDCWFAGGILPDPELQRGAFHLHWNGSSLTAEPNPQGRAVEDMRRFGRYLYESVRVGRNDKLTFPESASAPSDLHLITPIGVQPTFISLTPGVPAYAEGEVPAALDFLHLSSDERSIWGAADPAETPEGSAPGEVTIVHDSGNTWSQVLGPGADPPGGNPFTKFLKPQNTQEENANEQVNSVAAEPGGERAWLALTSGENASRGAAAPALVARISSSGEVSQRQTLPSSAEGETPKGVADKVACPAPEDCWLASTQGWLFHLSTSAARRAEQSNPDTDPAFSNPNPITFRPPDAGIPPIVPDAPPVDDSGLLGEPPSSRGSLTEAPTSNESRIPVALISHIRTRLLKGSVLELRFHLAVKARVRLLARRHRSVVASTPMRVFAAGDRRLLLRLNVRLWPTKLDLQSHALVPLPTVTVKEPVVGGPEHGGVGANTVGTSLVVLPHTPSFTRSLP